MGDANSNSKLLQLSAGDRTNVNLVYLKITKYLWIARHIDCGC